MAAAFWPPRPGTYGDTRLKNEALSPFIQSWRATQEAGYAAPPVVILQSHLLERLSPYLGVQRVRMFPHLSSAPFEDTATWLAELTAQHRVVWLLYDTQQDPWPSLHAEIVAWLTNHGYPVEQQQYHTIQATRYGFPLEDQPVTGAHFAGQARLVQASALPGALMAGDSLCIRLTWIADAPLNDDFGMFVHLLSPSQENWSRKPTRWPQVPTHAWTWA